METKNKINPGTIKPVNFYQKVIYYFQLRDFLWSLPLSIAIFWYSGYLFAYLFGTTTGFYDPAFIQPIFLAGVVVISASNVAQLAMYFNFRSQSRYLWGKYSKEEKGIVNYFKHEFKDLTPWRKMLLSLSIFAFWVLAFLVVFLKMV